MSTKTLASSQAKSIGGRDGRIETTDNILQLELTMPRALGGRNREGATNPEQLFAAGYAACFGNAVMGMARQTKVRVGEITVNATVDLFMNEEQLPTLGVALHVNLPGTTQEQAEEVVTKAHHLCPYSRAIRGNVAVNLTVTTDAAAAPATI